MDDETWMTAVRTPDFPLFTIGYNDFNSKIIQTQKWEIQFILFTLINKTYVSSFFEPFLVRLASMLAKRP
jgi:hypothetical protein